MALCGFWRSRCGFQMMPIEFLNGQPLGPDELETIRQEIESLDRINAISDEMRGIVARDWPHLLAKLPAEDAD
jgi:hypothetical protein